MKKFVMLTLLGLVTFGTVAAVKAQDPLFPQPGVPAPAPSQGALTDDDVKNLLTRLGYQFQEINSQGARFFALSVQRDGQTYRLGVTLSPNKKFLYLLAYVGPQLPSAEALSASGLLRVLELNNYIAPASYVYDAGARQIKVQMPLFNNGIDAETLRSMIETFVGNIRTGIDAASKLAPAPVPAFPQ
jgi:hypothetical protein